MNCAGMMQHINKNKTNNNYSLKIRTCYEWTLRIRLTHICHLLYIGGWIWLLGISKKEKASVTASHDYFLAEGSLTWWAIGASLIASNISAEQFIGMSGNGYFVGVAVAAYEWIAALALIIIAVWFMPVYLKIRYTPCRSFKNTL